MSEIKGIFKIRRLTSMEEDKTLEEVNELIAKGIVFTILEVKVFQGREK